MDSILSVVPALFALIGTVVGGLISFLTTYYLKKKEWHQKMLLEEIQKRENLYCDYMDETGRFLLSSIDIKIKRADEFAKLTMLLGKIRMISTPEVIEAAEQLASRVLDCQSAERKKAKEDDAEAQVPIFSTACRAELQNLKLTSR